MVENLKGLFLIYIKKECELKVEHQGDHATFLNLDITVKEGMLMYKLFNQRDSFLFSIVRMPHIESNIPQINIYLTIKGEFLRLIFQLYASGTLYLWLECY